MDSIIKCEMEITIPFHDVDYMDVVWHGHYVKYFENVRFKLFQLIGYDVPEMKKTNYMWPVIHLKVKYIKPAKYNQTLRVTAFLIEFENRVRIKYTLVDSVTLEKVCQAETDQVAVNAISGEMSLMSPSVLIEKVKAYLEK